MLYLLYVLIAVTSVLARPPTYDEEIITNIVNNTNVDYVEAKVNEIAGVSCELCLKAVYGVNYNLIRLKKAAEDMVKLDCEALFHGNAEDIAMCIRVMVEKIEHYYNKVEPIVDTRKLCVTLRMCAPEQPKTEDNQIW